MIIDDQHARDHARMVAHVTSQVTPGFP
jgi:hypothetical protein